MDQNIFETQTVTQKGSPPIDRPKGPALEVRNVTIQFGEEVVLKDVSLSVPYGQSLVLIGPSGGGKTVLLKAMAGIIEPKEGNVFIEGANWKELSTDDRRRIAKKIGMLFQKSALFDELTCAENVAFAMKEHTNFSPSKIDEIVQHLLLTVGLGQAYRKLPHELSGGMQRRLGIARALAMNPQIIFYDDPTAGLDPITSDKIADLIRELKTTYHSTVIIVTNDMRRAFELADRIVMVAGHGLIEAGTVSETKASTDPRLKQFITGQLHGPLTSILDTAMVRD